MKQPTARAARRAFNRAEAEGMRRLREEQAQEQREREQRISDGMAEKVRLYAARKIKP